MNVCKSGNLAVCFETKLAIFCDGLKRKKMRFKRIKNLTAKLLINLAILAAFLNVAVGQNNNTISGKVVNKAINVQKATVTLIPVLNPNFERRVTTESDSTYRFENVAAGDYKIRVSSANETASN